MEEEIFSGTKPEQETTPTSEEMNQERQELLNKVESLERANKKLHKSKAKAVLRHNQAHELKPYQEELLTMQSYLEEVNQPMIILFEGRDASGKGGTIRRVIRYMNEKHARVVALAKPTDREVSQWYLQRYIKMFPRGGEVVLFDRSWYNRAVVEPIFGFCTDKQYESFMRSVPEFEKSIIREGVILVKLYFSVSKKEQAYRFKRRETDPLRQWKLSEVDREVQHLWHEFTLKKYKMLLRTSTGTAPWHVIRSNDKHLARLNAMRVIVNAVDYPKNALEGVDYAPDPKIVISGIREIEIMEAALAARGSFKE